MRAETRVFVARRAAGILSLIFLTAATLAAQASDEATAGREIINKWQDVIVTVRLVSKTRMTMEGREVNKTEDKLEVPATVIDPSGLCVLSFSATSPGEMATRMLQMFGGGGGAPKVQVESENTDVKIRFPNAQEVPAQIVLRDKDLDLAFVRPLDKLANPVPALDLSKDVKPKILDRILSLSRLGKVGSWAPAASLDRIQAIIDKPRTFYVPGATGAATEMGTPVFSLDGRVIGIVLVRIAPPEGGSSMAAMSRGGGAGMLGVILPAADIREVAKQVPTK